MPQIVNAHVVQLGRLANTTPRLVQVGARSAFARARDDVRIALHARKLGKNGLCRGAQIERLFARLAIGEKQDAALKVQLRPLRVENFAKACSGQDKQPNGQFRGG